MDRIKELEIIIPALRERVLSCTKRVASPLSMDDRFNIDESIDELKLLNTYILEFRALKEPKKDS